MRSKSIPVTTGSVRLMSVNAIGFEVTDTKFPPGLKLESHYHNRACFSIIMEGGFDEGLGGKTYELLSASALCKPAGERHSDKFSGAGARVLVIEPAARQPEWLNPYTNVLESVAHFQDQGVEWAARRIVRELETPDAVTQMAVDGLALELLAMALRRQTGYAPPGEKRPPKWLARAQEYLHTGFTESLQIEDVAAAVGVHPVHLVYYLYMSSYRVNFERNMLPILPFTSILAAHALILLVHTLITRLPTSTPLRPRQLIVQNSKLILLALALLAVLPSTANSLRRGYRETQPDNRILASQWLDANTRAGAKLWLESQTPILTPNRYLVSQGNHVTEHDLSWYRDNRYEYLVLSSGAYKDVTYDNPDKEPHLRNAYLRFFDQNAPNLVASFPTNPIDRPGPTILIYRTGYTPPRNAAEVHPQHLAAALFREDKPTGGTARLLGADFPSTAPAGSTLPLLLYWTSNPPLQDDYTVFVHLIDASGNRPTQRDLGPRSNTYPTSQWQPDEVVLDEAPFDLPADLPPGIYTLHIGLYLQTTYETLPVSPAPGSTLPPNSGPNYVTLGPITIQPKQP